ncbi:unnamed protein product [Schistosoma spindalis]|nr:unnamed protein product [Schistosoma spindale]
MPNTRQRKSSSKLGANGAKLNDGSPLTKQVPFDVLKCHGSDSSRVDYHDSESSCDLVADDVENPSSDVKQAKSVMPVTPYVCLELPKVELSYFDGQPKEYWKFIRQFETYVASRVIDDSQRLLYLIHYCKGKAKSAIEGCVMMKASVGYKRAREILKRLFGQSHVIARETLEDLFNTVNVDCNDAEQLSNLAMKMENCAMILEQMNYTADLNSLVTLERIVILLPHSMQAQWANFVDKLTEDDREPTFDELTEFIASRARVASSRFGRLANRSKRGYNVKTSCHLQSGQWNGSTTKSKCSICSDDHSVYKCPRFLALTVQERWSHAKSKGICFVCLRQGHKANECKLTERCNVDRCGKKHHSLLHCDSTTDGASAKPGTQNYCGYTKSLNSQVCLGMIPVRLRSENAEIVGYALLDNGSDVTLIKSNCLRSLGLKEDQASVVVETVGGNRTTKVTNTPFEVYSLDRSEHITIEGALIVASIPGHKPTKSAMNNLVRWPHLSDVPINNLDYGEVLLLIGCDVPEAHWVLDQRLGERKKPYAVKTLLGWTVFGPASYPEFRKRVVNLTSKVQTLENQIRKLCDVEFADVYSGDKSVSVEDKAAIEIVERSTRFDNGHFVVPIPWKKNPNMKVGNYEVANSRLQSLKRRLLRDDSLHIKYTKSIESNSVKGYAEKVPEIHLQPNYHPRWYLPHHAVLNPKKPEKLRMVLDCAAKFSGVSLNDMICQGPDTTAELVCILLSFRKEAVTISADVEEMFMQVKVPESDRGALRFLWWQEGDMSREPSEFQMTSHPFGATSSSICANFAMIKTAQTFSDSYDRYVVDAVKNNFYVDCLISFSTCDQAKEFVKQITELLRKGGFKLKKWVTNSEEVYGELFSEFKTHSKVVSHNDLKELSPIILDGLICVGGRLSYSDFSDAFKHPIILPSRHLVTEMIIRHYHKEQGYTGTSQVLATIRKSYWIVKGTSIVRRVIGKCMTCRRFTMNLGQQLRAPLPVCRVQQGWYSFSNVGVDYFGPFLVKRGRSLEKRYGCVFTCLQTKAVHIEVTYSLNTDSFIMALVRFIGRRGKPAEIYSDNGSNFVGAVTELRKFVKQFNQQKISNEPSARQIQWHFNPPSSSHRGGVWERMIRSIRRLLLLITREQTLTDEALGTYLVEVERILNDRPLTPVIQDANDKLALSPNTLLLLRECDGIVDEGSVRDKYDKRSKQVNYLANVFWKRWLREYLPSLQKRQKWFAEHHNFQKGDVVIVTSDISTRGNWPLGVVEGCEIDNDEKVRTVTVRTNNGLVRRDIRKVCLLEGSN